MIIKLNVLQNGVCAQIYASAEDHEEAYFLPTIDYYLINGKPCAIHKFDATRVVKIWHNQNHNGLVEAAPIENCDNDYFVTFKSKVPFNKFCKKFYASEYNDPANYNFFKHNCSHGANFALKLAGIDLSITQGFRLVRVGSPESLIRLPLKALSPSDIYCMARDHKIRMLQNEESPLSHINFKMELATTKLSLWAKNSNNTQTKKNIDIITTEITKRMFNRPHHAELYLKVLIDTIDTVIHMTKKIIKYKNFANYFKERQLAYSTTLLNRYLNIGMVLLVLNVVMSAFVQNSIARSSISLAVLVTSIVGLLHHHRVVREEEWDYTPRVKKETRLSKAMFDLANDVKENDQVKKGIDLNLRNGRSQ